MICYCMTDCGAKMLQVIFFVIRCEAKFVKWDLVFSSAIESSAFLKLT